MKTHLKRPLRNDLRKRLHTLFAITTLCSMIFAALPHVALAQETGTPLFLPMISGGLAQPEEPPVEEVPNPEPDPELAQEFGLELDDTPFTSFDEIPAQDMDAALMAQAELDLPVPAPLAEGAQSSAVAPDRDGDGVPDAADNCPQQPNPPRNGNQPKTCGRDLVRLVNHLVFLQSRIFLPPAGFDPGLKRTQPRERMHVLLHVHPHDNGVMLLPQPRTNLQNLGVNFLGYLPHNTFYVSLPRTVQTLQQLIQLEHVRGISALRPKDKVSPNVRVLGPEEGRNDDGTLSFDVDFFTDVPLSEIEAALTQLGFAFAHEYEHTYRVTVNKWQDLRRLAIQDMVHYIDDLPDPAEDRTLDGQALINGEMVRNTLGLRGNGITVSMTESGLAEPINRAEIDGRVTLGNNPIFEPTYGDVDHPQMVSAIMIADETNFPERVGLLPEAELISYSTIGLTLRAQHFGVNEEAHNNFGAILSNNSWGPHNCNKIGKYSKRGKFFDRAVYDVGIAIVYAAGNTRGPNGLFADLGCQVELRSLPHPVAKNDISVGNWSTGSDAIAATSSAGPALDERLKPDIVAPGQGIDTIGWNENTLMSEAIEGGGTSAAAPVTSGVVGWIAESFLDQGVVLNTIMPARYKAILVHTAKDVGPTGPDYTHGYGLIQADRALRIAEEWNLWGREGVVDANNTQVVFPFDVTTPMALYKATLVWDDEEGEHTSTLALKNDLDLTLVSPSGVVYYPYDLPLPLGAVVDNGSVPCTGPACQDRLNNVEQVLVDPATDFIEQGTWQAVVNTNRLVSNEQTFSLVLTPPCPIELNRSVTLTDNLRCEGHELEPTAVLIQTDGVDLNCDNFNINGVQAGRFGFDRTYTGIRILADDVTVRNCEVLRFDVGIRVGDASNPDNAPRDATLHRNTLRLNGSFGMELVGNDHTASENSISEMVFSTGKGIAVRGNNVTLQENSFGAALPGGGGGPNNTIGIIVHAGSENGTISGNLFSGFWWYGIRLRGMNVAMPIKNFLIDNNEFEGIDEIPIELLGEVYDTTVSNNRVTAYGAASPGIHVVADVEVRPRDNVVSGNFILGFTNQTQTGIQIFAAQNTHVQGNTLQDVTVGIVEDDARDSLISGNQINPTQPAGNFRTAVGIQSTESFTLTTINNNTIRFSNAGIIVDDPVHDAAVAQNTIEAMNVGIRVEDAWQPVISSNNIRAHVAGIALANAPRASVGGNNMLLDSLGSGITVFTSDEAAIGGNEINLPTVGIGIGNSESVTVAGNLISEPVVTGIVIAQDTASLVDDNEINLSVLGIHYRSGKDAVVSNNTVNSVAGGTGIQLGTGPAACPVNVDNILVQDNVLSGGAVGVDVLCDVGAHTLINN